MIKLVKQQLLIMLFLVVTMRARRRGVAMARWRTR
jgi:hypothetical protein